MFTITDRFVAGKVDAIATTHLNVSHVPQLVATAVRDNSKNLKTILWLINDAGDIIRGPSFEAGRIGTSIGITQAYFGGFVVAICDNGGNLKLKSYYMNELPTFASPTFAGFNEADFTGGRASIVSITTLEGGFTNSSDPNDSVQRIAVAVRNSAGNLEVQTYDVIYNVSGSSVINHNIVKRGEAIAGTIREVAIENVSSSRFVTAVRDNGGNLKVIVWDVSANGQISRRGDVVRGGATKIAIARIGTNRFYTVCRTIGGKLKIILWETSGSGQPVAKDDNTIGEVSLIAAFSQITAVRDGSGKLRMIEWRFTGSDKVLDEDRGTIGEISLVSISRLVTAVRDNSGKLRIINWRHS